MLYKFRGSIVGLARKSSSFSRTRRLVFGSSGSTSKLGIRAYSSHIIEMTRAKAMSSRKELDTLLSQPATEKLDPKLVQQILARPPFVPIPGTFNSRDIGAPLPFALGEIEDDNTHNPHLRAKYAYRTGSLENLSSEGKETIASLGIRKIFDLRSAKELEHHPDPEIADIEVIWKDNLEVSSLRADPASQGADAQASNIEARDQSGDLLVNMYIDMLKTHKPSFHSVFKHIRDHPDQPFLFHCTAGKDRTGLLAALILGVTTTPIDHINQEYALSRIGIELARPMLVEKLTGGKHSDVSALTGRYRAYAEVPFGNAMTPVFDHIQKVYGGVDGYLSSALSFSVDDINKIRVNLAGKPDPS